VFRSGAYPFYKTAIKYIILFLIYNTMNYNLARQRYGPQGADNYTINIGLRSGGMPAQMLAEKFEETDIGPDEDAYDMHVRREICDWTGDRNLMEHERPRGGVNARKGLLELRANGHRGTADVETPEIFLGFGGPEDRDPRGTNVDPDMKQMVRQQQARMRFKRFTPDHSDDVTGGGRSEAMVMSDKQKGFRLTRERLKVFDRQIDGRREGLRRTWRHKSEVSKQVLVQSYGDFIKDYAMNPQRRANMIAGAVIRDSKEWRTETSDQDYTIAKYSQICRRRTTANTQNRKTAQSDDTKWQDGDDSKTYRAVGLLLANILRGKRTLYNGGDVDMYKSENTQTRKNAPAARDLAAILRAMVHDADLKDGDTTTAYKTAEQGRVAVVARQTVYNHIAPAHHALNAEIIYKSVRPGADTRAVSGLVITDPKTFAASASSQTSKAASRFTSTGRKLGTKTDDDRTESEQTVSYKKLLHERKSKNLNTATDTCYSESDKSQIRRELNKTHKTVTPILQEQNIKFHDTPVAERLGGGLGSKYTMREVDRDNRTDSISGDN
jgi:hypothetical protein